MDAPRGTRHGKRMAPRSGRLRGGRLRSGWVRQLCADANDGIIGTAGVLQGFSGAGGTSHLLLVASVATMIAGSLAQFGTTYAQESAERDAQLRLIAEEAASLDADPAAGIEELTTRFVNRGVPRDLAREVAEDMHEHDPLGAQLDQEYGIREPMSRTAPYSSGARSALGYALGSTLPLTVLLLYPAAWETRALFVAVILSLCVTSVLIALSTGGSVVRALVRTVGIGVASMLISYVAGLVVF